MFLKLAPQFFFNWPRFKKRKKYYFTLKNGKGEMKVQFVPSSPLRGRQLAVHHFQQFILTEAPSPTLHWSNIFIFTDPMSTLIMYPSYLNRIKLFWFVARKKISKQIFYAREDIQSGQAFCTPMEGLALSSGDLLHGSQFTGCAAVWNLSSP